jgi:hypothetical protein
MGRGFVVSEIIRPLNCRGAVTLTRQSNQTAFQRKCFFAAHGLARQIRQNLVRKSSAHPRCSRIPLRFSETCFSPAAAPGRHRFA